MDADSPALLPAVGLAIAVAAPRLEKGKDPAKDDSDAPAGFVLLALDADAKGAAEDGLEVSLQRAIAGVSRLVSVWSSSFGSCTGARRGDGRRGGGVRARGLGVDRRGPRQAAPAAVRPPGPAPRRHAAAARRAGAHPVRPSRLPNPSKKTHSASYSPGQLVQNRKSMLPARHRAALLGFSSTRPRRAVA